MVEVWDFFLSVNQHSHSSPAVERCNIKQCSLAHCDGCIFCL